MISSITTLRIMQLFRVVNKKKSLRDVNLSTNGISSLFLQGLRFRAGITQRYESQVNKAN